MNQKKRLCAECTQPLLVLNSKCGVLAEHCRHEGMDIPIYVTYFRKKDLTYFVDAPVLYSELCKSGETKEQIAKRLLARCNELGKMDPDAISAAAATPNVMCG